MTRDGFSQQAATRGEPSYVWRDGQQRRLEMILDATRQLPGNSVLEVGCGVGIYLEKVGPMVDTLHGLEYEFSRAETAKHNNGNIVQAAAEQLPYPDDSFDWLFSNEVIEHVRDDRTAVEEMVRTLKPGGRLLVFCPNRWYPFETHGIYWRGEYHFGNIPLVNYLPLPLRNRLAPHVRAYTRRQLQELFRDLQVRPVLQTVIFGGYDNIIQRFPRAGRILRAILQGLERTPLKRLGLSHFWVLEKSKEQ